jgi:hypothetical protein
MHHLARQHPHFGNRNKTFVWHLTQAFQMNRVPSKKPANLAKWQWKECLPHT